MQTGKRLQKTSSDTVNTLVNQQAQNSDGSENEIITKRSKKQNNNINKQIKQNEQQSSQTSEKSPTQTSPSQQNQQKSLSQKASKKPLKLFRPTSFQNLPSIEEVDDTFKSFKNSFYKLYSLIKKCVTFVLMSIWLTLKFILTLILVIIREVTKLMLLIVVFINKKCLRKINRKDPFKRSPININYSRLQELNDNKVSYGEKPFNLVLDLDETIVCSSTKKKWRNCYECPVTFKSGSKMTYYVKKRPFLDEFLLEISKYYNIIIYTASLQEYADAILDKIDRYNLFKKRLYRDSCIKHPEGYIKDLGLATKSLSNTVMIDNSKIATQLNKVNTFIIPPYRGKDDEDYDLFNNFQEVLQYFAIQKTDFRDLIQEIKDDYF